MTPDYLNSVTRQFEYYKMLGDKTIERLPAEKLFWQPNAESNSIAIIVKHLHGNMMSRWTDFMTSDGEKEWRRRDEEFDNDLKSKDEITTTWNEGWDCLFTALRSLTDKDLSKLIYIRNQGHTVVEAINRQLAHYPYHIGQMVYIGKLALDTEWQSLSIPRGHSDTYNTGKFSKEKRREHFIDEYLRDANTEK